MFRNCSRNNVVQFLAVALEEDPSTITYALSTESTLYNLGILRINRGRHVHDLHSLFDIQHTFDAVICEANADDDRLLSMFFRPSEPPSLGRRDFSHIHKDFDIIASILRWALTNDGKGINILLHGPPGTGKTELAKVLATELGIKLAVVPEMDSGGNAVQTESRLTRLIAAQQAFANKQSGIILIDEAEDILCDSVFATFSFSAATGPSKAAINRILETNTVPVIWISNNADSVDPAYIRRFTYTLELDFSGASQREDTFKQLFTNYPISSNLIGRIAQHERVSPALVVSALNAATVAVSGTSHFEPTLARTLNNHLNAMGERPLPRKSKQQGLVWRAECIQADVDITALLEELDPEAGARFCLYGPPGTGKTAWGKQLARKLNCPLMVRRASDLVSSLVGDTEESIARAFDEAEADNAVLLIDEADSFLDDRSNARQSWQISQVNQFLTSMEAFEGFLVCTTNFDARLDVAAMRRFDFRVGFDYLTLEMAVILFRDLCELAEASAPEPERLRGCLAGMDRLAPGDFHVLARRLRIRKVRPSAEQLLEDLRAECAYKEEDGRGIGFQAAIH